METTLVHICESAIGLIVLFALCFEFWPDLRVDEFRQGMFSIRDELFDYAASGKIRFDHQAYKLLRQSMNGFIRYAHRLTFFQLVLTIMRWRALLETPELAWAANWERALKSIQDPEVRSKLDQFHNRAMSLVLQRLIFGSPVLLFILFCAVVSATLNAGWKNFKQVCRETATHVVSRFIDPRLLEEEAVKLAV